MLLQFLIGDQLATQATVGSGGVGSEILPSSNVPTTPMYAFVREKTAISELLRVMWMSRPEMLTEWHQDGFTRLFLLSMHELEAGMRFLTDNVYLV